MDIFLQIVEMHKSGMFYMVKVHNAIRKIFRRTGKCLHFVYITKISSKNSDKTGKVWYNGNDLSHEFHRC